MGLKYNFSVLSSYPLIFYFINSYSVFIKFQMFSQTYEGTHRDLFKSSISDSLVQVTAQLHNLVALVETTVDLDRVSQHEYVINSKFDGTLGELRIDIDECKDKIESHYQEVKSDVGPECGKCLKLDHTSLLGHFVRVTKKESSAIQDNPKFRILEARKEGVRFTTDTLQVWYCWQIYNYILFNTIN